MNIGLNPSHHFPQPNKKSKGFNCYVLFTTFTIKMFVKVEFVDTYFRLERDKLKPKQAIWCMTVI